MQARILISGFVQGVSFRYFIKDNAERLEITGWARNTKDGKVEALLQGKDKKLQELINLCKKGPEMAKVANIEEFSAKEPKFENFIIKDL